MYLFLLDIHSESKIYELERRAKEQIAAAIAAADFDASVGDNLFKLGWRSVAELSRIGMHNARDAWHGGGGLGEFVPQGLFHQVAAALIRAGVA